MVCKHLEALEQQLILDGIEETYRGQPWSKNCREWVYFDCLLDLESLRHQFNFPDLVEDHTNDDPRSGLERGFYCSVCHDAIMGRHD